MEGEPADRAITEMITAEVAQDLYHKQDWLGMELTTPIISSGMNAVRMFGFFENIDHST